MTINKWHRANGPVINQSWYLFYTRHRYYGPAYTASTYQLEKGIKPTIWFIHGDKIK